ncbi:hypothetical protein SN13T_3430 [Lactiplantibacillus plantarum]|nr:hypothetical protein SN13T_3430 [Lactiplantibacillus plantarum]
MTGVDGTSDLNVMVLNSYDCRLEQLFGIMLIDQQSDALRPASMALATSLMVACIKRAKRVSQSICIDLNRLTNTNFI